MAKTITDNRKSSLAKKDLPPRTMPNSPRRTLPRKAKKARKTHDYSTYIYKVLKQTHKDKGMSKKGMAVMNSLVKDIFEKISKEASQLAEYDHNRGTLMEKDIQTAVRLIFPGELGKHAVSEGVRAITKFHSG